MFEVGANLVLVGEHEGTDLEEIGTQALPPHLVHVGAARTLLLPPHVAIHPRIHLQKLRGPGLDHLDALLGELPRHFQVWLRHTRKTHPVSLDMRHMMTMMMKAKMMMKAHLVFGRDVLVGDVLKHLGHEDQLTLQLRTRLLYLQLIDESSVV